MCPALFSCNPIGLIRADMKARAVRLYGTSSRRNLLKAWCADGAFAMVVYRLMQACRRCGIVPGAMFFNKLNVIFGGCVIGRGADFGPGFVMVHSNGIVINGAVRGGAGIVIEHQVTIGAGNGGSPRLGDNVFVGAGARIIGAVRIGTNVKIGANAVVTRDIPDGVTAVGVPARIVG